MKRAGLIKRAGHDDGFSGSMPSCDRVVGDREMCGICNQELSVCVDQRRAFHSEPWLPPCFELGAQWYSRDAGLEWTRYPHPASPEPYAHRLTVIAINRHRGEVTFKVTK